MNDIFVCAEFSALTGMWNEELRSEGAFVTALKYMCGLNRVAVEASFVERRDASFLQSEIAE